MNLFYKASAILLFAFFCIGCDDSPEPISDEVIFGRFQVGFLHETLDPIGLRVLDESGEPIAGAEVTFRLLDPPAREGFPGANATLSQETVVTDANGAASTVATLGDTPGHLIVEARSSAGNTRPIWFHLWSYPQPESETQKPLCVLSFNDFHMHFDPWGPTTQTEGGIARLASLLHELRAENDEAGVRTVVLNQGDDFENTFYQNEPGAIEAMFQTWDRIGVDFWQVGNHDFHFGIAFLTDKLLAVHDGFEDTVKGHPMIVTWGNVDPGSFIDPVANYADYFEQGFNDESDQLLYQQTAVIDVDGLNVGVFGAVTDAAVYIQVIGDPDFFQTVGAPNPEAQGLTFYNPDPREDSYVGEAIDELDRLGADIILLNSHTGLGLGDRVNIPPGKDEHIARYGQGTESGRAVDLILSGHSHLQLNHAVFIENPAGYETGIIQALEGGVFVGRADLMVDTETNEVTWVDSALIQIDGTLEDDPETAEMASSMREQLESHHPEVNQVVAQTETFISSRERTMCSMGQMINASFSATMEDFLEEGQVAIPLSVPSIYRTNIHPGPIDGDLVYQVLSMHKMDTIGTNNDTLASVTFRPGLYNISFFNIGTTFQYDVTIAEYALEIVHSLQSILESVMPSGGSELRLEVLQLGNVSYTVDHTAEPFSRVISDSILINGEPPNADTTYVLTGPHSILFTLAYVMESMIFARDASTDEQVSALIRDSETDLPYTDTEIPIWQSLFEYLEENVGEDGMISQDLRTMTGEYFRTVQPDLTSNSTDIAFDRSPVSGGETVNITVLIRNLGQTPVESATVGLYYETTPWDRTDDPDRFASLEGFSEGYLYSRSLIDEQTISVDAYPDTAELNFSWTVPEGMVPGGYPVEVMITDTTIETIDPNTKEPYREFSLDNNSGRQRARILQIQ